MINFELIEELFANSKGALADSIQTFAPINTILYEHSTDLILLGAVIMFICAFIAQYVSFFEIDFTPKKVVSTLAFSFVLLYPVDTSEEDILDPSLTTKASSTSYTFPLAPYVAWYMIGVFFDYIDEAQEAIKKGQSAKSFAILNDTYTSNLLSSYSNQDVVNNVTAYHQACGPYASGAVPWPDTISEKPSKQDFKRLGFLGGTLGYDPLSQADLEDAMPGWSVDELVSDDETWDHDNYSVSSQEEQTSLERGWESFKSVFVGESEMQSSLNLWKQIPLPQKIKDRGFKIPTASYLQTLDSSTADQAQLVNYYYKNTTMLSSNTGYEEANKELMKKFDISVNVSEILFYPGNCAEMFEVARMSVVAAMIANTRKSAFSKDINSGKATVNENVGVQMDIMSINTMAVQGLYGASEIDSDFLDQLGSSIAGVVDGVQNYFKGISTEFNSAVIFGWSVLCLAFLINIFPLIAVVASLLPNQWSVYATYFQLLAVLTLTLVLVRLFNIVVEMMYEFHVAKMQLEFIQSGGVTRNGGGMIIAIHYGSIAMVAASSAVSYMFVSNRVASLGGGNSHIGETLGAGATFAAAPITKIAVGAADSAATSMVLRGAVGAQGIASQRSVGLSGFGASMASQVNTSGQQGLPGPGTSSSPVFQPSGPKSGPPAPKL